MIFLSHIVTYGYTMLYLLLLLWLLMTDMHRGYSHALISIFRMSYRPASTSQLSSAFDLVGPSLIQARWQPRTSQLSSTSDCKPCCLADLLLTGALGSRMLAQVFWSAKVQRERSSAG